MDTKSQDIKQVLLVEDDPEDVKMTLEVLAEGQLAGVFTVARDGEEALDYLYRRGKYAGRTGGEPGLILLDNKMPKVNGLEVLKIIKADEHLKMIPVVAFTSSRLPSDLTEFYKCGVNAYVVKPMGVKEYVTVIQELSVFWIKVNEPPPATGVKAVGRRDGEPEGPGLFDAWGEHGGKSQAMAHIHHFPAAGKNNGSGSSQ